MDCSKGMLTILSQLLRDYALSDQKIIVAVSGGADSLALLHALYHLHPSHAFSLHVATLDHGLRGSAGAADADAVVELARAWGLGVTRGVADVYTALYDGEGIEAAARRIRYAFLAQVAREQKARYIAVGHHADDQAETILWHIIRGSGLKGLGGMRVQSTLPNHPDLVLLRPLLSFTRQQIEAYCREQGLSPREDATNRQLDYTRNAIRWRILPLLRAMNPQIHRTLGHLGEATAIDWDFIDHQATEQLAPYWEKGPEQRLRFPIARYRGLHAALKRRLVQMALAALSGTTSDVSFAQIRAAVDCADKGVVGKWSPLGRGWRLRVAYEHLVFEPSADGVVPEHDFCSLTPGQVVGVNARGLTHIPNADWRLHIASEPPASYQARMALPPNVRLSLRTWRAGDRFAPLGMGGRRRKLQDWFVDNKVPRPWRAYIPLLLADEEIIAIVYGAVWTISERVRSPHADNPTVYLQILR